METEQKTKSKVVAALLAFFLGSTGAHRYYLGYKKQGAVQTCGFISFYVGAILSATAGYRETGLQIIGGCFMLFGAVTIIWAVIDFFRILTGGLTPADGSYASNQQGSDTVRNGQSYYTDILEAIEKAGQLREQGVLTDEEFWHMKNKLLAKF